MFSSSALIALAAVLGPFVLLAVFMFLVEPKRRRRILRVLRINGDWTYGRDVGRQSGVLAVYVTLAQLEDDGLVERRTEEPREGDKADAGVVFRSLYRLTPKGRVATA